MHLRVFSVLPGACPLDARSTTPKMSLDTMSPRWGKSPPVEDHWSIPGETE